MKKHLVKSLLCILLILTLCTGCGLGSYQENPGVQGNNGTSGSDATTDVTDPNGTTGSTQPDEPVSPDTPYTVTLYYNMKQFVPEDAEIQVIWHGQSGNVVVDLAADGTANAGVLDGDYDITILGLPEEYTYDPNAYRVTADQRHADIMLLSVTEPESGNGGVNASPDKAMYTNGGCYEIKYEGIYRVVIEKPNQTFFFEYQPLTKGVYSVSSLCDIYEDNVNPTLYDYGFNVAFKRLGLTVDSGGPAQTGGFTQNFRYQFDVTATGQSITFGVSASSKTDEYPITLDIVVKREGDYNPASAVVIPVEAESALLRAKDSNEQYNSADMGTKVFDRRNFKLEEATGLYRVYDEERYADNDGWGPYLMCDIMNKPVCYTITSLYKATRVGLGQNYLKLRVWTEAVTEIDEDGNEVIVQAAGYVNYDYTDFITQRYYSVCNSDGRCYVTEELADFLQLFATNHMLWTDNVCPSEQSPEDYGYSASDRNMWLFACGFYEDGR